MAYYSVTTSAGTLKFMELSTCIVSRKVRWKSKTIPVPGNYYFSEQGLDYLNMVVDTGY